MAFLLLISLVTLGAAQQFQRETNSFGNSAPQPPQYPEITSCPEPEGLQLYPYPTSCHEFYLCANGTLTQEVCENGLLFDGQGAVHNYCNYHWAVDCEGRAADVVPIGGSPCEYAFGIFSAGACEQHFVLCAHGEAELYPCEAGLVYDDRIYGCNWPDLVDGCDPEAILNFRCPDHIDPKDPAYQFLPFPRFPTQDCTRYITCVDGYPRLVGCGDYQVFNEETLTCDDPENVPNCNI